MEWENEKEQLGKDIIEDLYGFGLIKTWYRDKPDGWTLVSGMWSPLYIQLRPMASYPFLLRRVGYAMGRMIEEECTGNKILGIAMAGVPIATAIALSTGIPACFTRKLEGVRSPGEVKDQISHYGEHALIEGDLENGDRFTAVDDLVTRFDSKLVALEQLRWEAAKRGLNMACGDVAVLLDREQGAMDTAQKFGIRLHALIPFRSKGLLWLQEKISPVEYEILRDYLEHPDKYQSPHKQKEVKKL